MCQTYVHADRMSTCLQHVIVARRRNACCRARPGSVCPALGSPGEVAARLNAPHSKCGIRVTVSGVQISPSPPHVSFRSNIACSGERRVVPSPNANAEQNECDFSKAERGPFYHSARISIRRFHLDSEVRALLTTPAGPRGIAERSFQRGPQKGYRADRVCRIDGWCLLEQEASQAKRART
jgi:hypothetical protein